MTKADTARIMAILQTAYPRYYANQTREQLTAAVNLWADLFADDAPDVVLAAVKAHIATDTTGYPPVIGQIKAQITKLTAPPMLTEQEAWALVYRAACNAAYHAQDEFDRLPPVLQRLVGNPSQLRDWALMDADELQTVVASNFQRSYRARAKEWMDYQALPGAIREKLDALTDGMRFPGERRELPEKILKRLEGVLE